MSLIELIASDAVIDKAYAWLRNSREHHSANADVWDLRFRWEIAKPQLQADLLAGRYRFDVVRRFQSGVNWIEYWSAPDALVIKAMTLVLGPHLRPHLCQACHHLQGHGGAKAAVRRVAEAVPAYAFVFRTDVKGYYAHIEHDVLGRQLRQYIHDGKVLDLLRQYMRRTFYTDGLYRPVTRGICFGCSLSPLIGALYLKPVDDLFTDGDLFYARYMDDWVILATSRWKLRRAVAKVNRTLDDLCVAQHPDKTFIGRTDKGFTFLGYRFSPDSLSIAQQTHKQCLDRVARLYEQGADLARIWDYMRRWLCWCRSGLDDHAVSLQIVPVMTAAQLCGHDGETPRRSSRNK